MRHQRVYEWREKIITEKDFNYCYIYSSQYWFRISARRTKMKIAEFANDIDTDEVVHHKPPHLGLLQFLNS